MNPFLIHLGSGTAFFSGAGLIAFGVVLAVLAGNRWMLAGADIVAVCGVLLVFLSSTPIAPWFFWTWMLATGVALVLAHTNVLLNKHMTAGATVLLCRAAAVIVEAPHHFTPGAPTVAVSRLYVVGDSISSGVGRENGPTWVRLIDEQQGVEVVDLSRPGATLCIGAGPRPSHAAEGGAGPARDRRQRHVPTRPEHEFERDLESDARAT